MEAYTGRCAALCASLSRRRVCPVELSRRCFIPGAGGTGPPPARWRALGAERLLEIAWGPSEAVAVSVAVRGGARAAARERESKPSAASELGTGWRRGVAIVRRVRDKEERGGGYLLVRGRRRGGGCEFGHSLWQRVQAGCRE